MNKMLNQKYYILVSFVSAVSVYLLSMAFQSMAYWGNTVMWYWVGVVITYIVWSIGIIFLIMSFRNNKFNLIYSISYLVAGLLLITGFIWVSFIIVMGSVM